MLGADCVPAQPEPCLSEETMKNNRRAVRVRTRAEGTTIHSMYTLPLVLRAWLDEQPAGTRSALVAHAVSYLAAPDRAAWLAEHEHLDVLLRAAALGQEQAGTAREAVQAALDEAAREAVKPDPYETTRAEMEAAVKRGVTLTGIARRAGVDPAQLTRLRNGHRGISPEALGRVVVAIRALR